MTALVALNPPGGVVSITAFSGSLYAACFLPSLLFGLYWNRGNGQAVLASYAAGIACLIIWPHLPEGALVHRVFPAVILSTLAYVSVSLLTPPAAPRLRCREFRRFSSRASVKVAGSGWCQSVVKVPRAPRPFLRPPDKALWARIPGVCGPIATQSGGLHCTE